MRLRRHAYTGGGGFIFSPTISTVLTAYNVRTAAMAAGWDGVSALFATITIASAGALVGSIVSSALAPALTVPADIPAGSQVRVVNNGYIAGYFGRGGAGGYPPAGGTKGEDGGVAIFARRPLILENFGVIAGGGGGGGGGSGTTAVAVYTVYARGGSGGNGGMYPSTARSNGAFGELVTISGDWAQGGPGGAGGEVGFAGTGGTGGSGISNVSNTTPGIGGFAGPSVDGGEFVTWVSGGELIGPVKYSVNNYIPTPAATPGNRGDAFQGGFYVGNVFNELAPAITPVKIPPAAPGRYVTVFAAAALAAPQVYAGQKIEIRSRATPANRVIGTVSGASGGHITIALSSAMGAGEFSDASLMAEYRIIVAPKAQGEALRALMASAVSAPTECFTLTEGARATAAMVAAGDATAFPAANFCAGLSIGGYSDWYLPARDEIERLWTFLKPTLNQNYVTANRPTGAMASYATSGAFDDVSPSHGVNVNAAPPRTAYTTTQPGQLNPPSNVNFRTGGSEALAYGVGIYLTATEYSSTDVWAQSYESASPGRQITINKTALVNVRAVRRSLI